MANLALPGLTGAVSYVGDAVSSDLFGANFLFDRDGGPTAGTISDSFKAFADEVDLGTLRYPGGTVTEVALDLSDPNSTNANFSGVNNTRIEATVGVSDFLDYAASLDASATFVLPTYRFLSDAVDATGNHMIDSAQESALRSYVDFVLTDAMSKGVTVAGFEIGNEWYVDNSKVFGFQMSPIEYGRVAAYVSVVVDQEIDKLNASLDSASRIDPDIIVQVGPGGNAEVFTPDGQSPAADYSGPVVSATELIFNQFTSMESRAAVDAVLSHRYLTGSDSSVNGWAYQPSKTWAALAAATPGFTTPKIYVTEWNVAARNSDEQGLKQVDSMVELVREMAVAGVDHADVWAVEQNNKTRLIQNTGLGAEVYGGLSLGGVVFDMMATQLKGTQVISGSGDISGVDVNAFGSATKGVYFLSNRSETDRTDSITLQATKGGPHHVTIYEITSEDDGTPIVTIRTINLTSTAQQIPLEFSANETMMVVVTKGTSGAVIEGYDQFDQLTGSAYSDTILGGGGDDTLVGLTGNDQLSGETGNDSISGGDGNDALSGGSGADQLDGGVGNDILAGGAGDDTLIGGVGLDVASYASATQGLVLGLGGTKLTVDGFGTDSLSGIEGLEGGSGNDRLIGDAAANILMGGLGDDTLVGGVGNDTLIGGDGIDTADYSGATGAISLNLGLTPAQVTRSAGTDTLKEIENVTGSAFNDTLTGDLGANRLDGGAGRDIITGAAGADSLFGGDGDDLFVISSFGDHVSGEQIVGGAGLDELRFTGTTAGTLVLDHDVDVERVVIGTGTATAAVTTGKIAINVDASAVDHGISILGNAGVNRLTGGAGADQLDGGVGNDTLAGGAGDDTLIGGVGLDVASYASATQGLVLSLGGTTLTVDGFGTDSLSGIEGLEGGSGNDRLIGDAAANILMGGLGDDALVGGVGNDTLIGGAGIDTAVYSGATGAVAVNLGLTPAQATSGAGTDLLQQIENVTGSAFNDTLTGDLGANRLDGGAGRDIITGGGGADALFGGDGDDLFVISGFGDHVSGEQIVGGAGLDELRFTGTTAGTLVLDHSVDVDRVVIGTGVGVAAVMTGTTAINIDASAVDHGLSVFGNAGVNRLTGGAGADQLDGGAGNDFLAGGGGDDTLFGGIGVDDLSGGAGNDILFGGAGNDILTGGGGADEFVVSSSSDGIDRITDFDLVHDGLDYSDILVFDGVGVGEFQYLGASNFTGGLDNSEAIFSGGKILVDINGDGVKDITLILDGLVSPDQLNSSDFMFKS